MGRPPPSFGQCPKENVFFSSLSIKFCTKTQFFLIFVLFTFCPNKMFFFLCQCSLQPIEKRYMPNQSMKYQSIDFELYHIYILSETVAFFQSFPRDFARKMGRSVIHCKLDLRPCKYRVASRRKQDWISSK